MLSERRARNFRSGLSSVMPGTRRLAAILAAEVAGYSRLIGADEGRTLQRLVAEHRGRIVKTTGDGVLVEFNSVVDALRCASQVQERMVERNDSTDADSDEVAR